MIKKFLTLNFRSWQRLLALAPILALSACSQPDGKGYEQSDLNQLAESLQVRYQVVDNLSTKHCDKEKDSEQHTGEQHANEQQGTTCFVSEITLKSAIDLPAGPWAIYFSQVAPAQKVVNGEFSIEHINGDLHRLIPRDSFKGFKANQAQKILFVSDIWHLSRSDLMPNYYVAAPALDAKIIDSTRIIIDPETGLETQPYSGTFDNREKHLLRSAKDLSQRATAASIYEANHDTRFNDQAIGYSIIPTPDFIQAIDGRNLDLSAGLALNLTKIEASAVDAAMIALAGQGLNASDSGVPLNINLIAGDDASSGSYQLRVSEDRIDIKAADNEGAANALRSLASLLMPGTLSLPQVYVEDSPRYPFRGLHVDVARNFHSKQLLLNLLEQMAVFKLNKLHLHLGDDEGWRLQIDGLPELTEIGAKRCHDPDENTCLLPQLGSGPDANSEVNGFYSNKDYIEILRYADARHIQVIPSFDMPGHSRAAVKSMEARYRKFMAKEQPDKAKQYLLSDAMDTTKYSSVQFYKDNTINACMESSYDFLEKVILEVSQLHEQAGQALTKYHIGADETAGAWVDSPVCQRFFANTDNGIETAEDLSAYFIERVAKMLADKGIKAAGWNDGMGLTNKDNMPSDTQSNAWTPLVWGGHISAHEQANRGWEMIVSSPDVTYFDTPYELDPEEPGYYWPSRETNTRKVFNFMPDNLPVHAELLKGREGEDVTIDDRLQKNDKGEITHAPMARGNEFKGLQGHIWSETVRSDARVEYMLFPRLIALAERAWHTAAWELPYDYAGQRYAADTVFFSQNLRAMRDQSWNEFASQMSAKVLPKLDRAGIRYRLPPPGAKVLEGQLFVNTIFPSLPVEYRLNENQWTPWLSPVAVQQSDRIEVRTLTSDHKRKGRSWQVQ